MHSVSAHIVCLLVAQYGSDNGYQTNPPPVAPPATRSVPFTDQARPQVNPSVNATTVPVHSQTSLARAEALVEQFVTWDANSIEGNSVTLLECIQNATATGQQSATIQAYWQLCIATGQYTQAEQQVQVLTGVAPQSAFEQSQIHAAQRSAEARRAQARVDLVAAQENLGEVANLPDATLPLPADRPFVGKYKTRLTTMFAGRVVPRQLRKVDRALPHQLKLIEQRAEAVDANSRLLSDLAQLYQQGQVPLSELLGTCQELSTQQSEFLLAVLKYNHQIATYSQNVVGNRLPAESILATLIRERPTAASPRVFRDNNVLPASAQQPQLGGPSGLGRLRNEPVGNVRSSFESDNSNRRSLTQPRGSQPFVTQPRGSQPRGSQPRGSQPRDSQPFDSQPFETQPPETQPQVPQPPAVSDMPVFDPNASFQFKDTP